MNSPYLPVSKSLLSSKTPLKKKEYTPMFSFDQNKHIDQCPQMFVPNFQNTSASSSSSSSSLSCHGFFNPVQDQAEFLPPAMHQPPHQHEVKIRAPQAGSHDLEKRADKGLKFSLWKNEDQREVKWISSKMRMMQKMKNHSDHGKEITSNIGTSARFEDHKQQQASSSVTDRFTVNNASSYNNNSPIRVCADCNTTKTPLWRSGPKGPKSLCNACGIRQRKARRAAMAAAAAAENGKSVTPETADLKMKVQNKEFKKRCKPAALAESSNAAHKKKGLEDFLFNLSKNLAFHRVFPQEEKDAAILLMALSCSRVHG